MGRVIWLRNTSSPENQALRINGIGYLDQMPKTLVDRPQGTSDYLFMHFHAPATVWLHGRMQDCPAHSLVVWQPSQRHTFGNISQPWNHSWLHCQGSVVTKALGGGIIPFAQVIRCADGYLVDRWLNAMMDELARAVRPDPIILESLFIIWVREIKRLISKEPGILPERLRTVVRLMESDISHPWTLAELAGRAHLSPSRFSVEFRTFLGGPPMDYLLRLRLRHALHCLRDFELSIADVAARVGFADAFYFSRQFRRFHGQSPLRYRQRLSAG